MEVYVEFSAQPPRFAIHPLPDGMAQVDFYEDAERLPCTEGERWCAFQTTLITHNHPALAARIGQDLAAWRAAAMEKACIDAEPAARAARNAALAETDYLFASDFPIADAQRAEVAAYRQALRDLTNAPGWPTRHNLPRRPSFLTKKEADDGQS